MVPEVVGSIPIIRPKLKRLASASLFNLGIIFEFLTCYDQYMKTKLLISLVLGIVLIGAVTFWIQKDRASAPSLPPENAQDLPLKEGIVTIRGEVICLPHKDTSGPQTLECAIGIRDDKGTNYALRADDPSETGSLTGKRVQVSGKLQPPDSTSKYNTAGTLLVQSIKQL